MLALTAAALAGGACASAPVQPVPEGPTFEQKMTSILRLEDHRILRDPAPPVPPAPPSPAPKKKTPVVVLAPPPPPDLTRMLTDPEARVRRRTALAIGRVGLAEGAAPLAALLGDDDPEVRQMAAFALGLLGPSAKDQKDALVKALTDESPLVQGSAAEALGLIGDAGAADAIGRMVAQNIQAGALAKTDGDDEGRRDTPDAAARLGVYALVRLKAYTQLSAAIFDANGQLRVHAWPVAFALQRLEDKRSQNALVALAKDPNPYTRAFAVTGLGRLRDRASLDVLLPMLADNAGGNRSVLIEAIRAVGRIGDPSAIAPLLKIIQTKDVEPHVKLEAVTALAGFHELSSASVPGLADTILDLVTDAQPGIRAAALRAEASIDPDGFMSVLSGLEPDPHWTVRAALASVLATMPQEKALPRLTAMLNDGDQRAVPAVLNALVRLKAPGVGAILLQKLKADDPVVRVAAANGVGEVKPEGGAQALADAYKFGERDGTYIARGAALAALAKFGAAAAVPVLKEALADKDWALRVRAAQLVKTLVPPANGGPPLADADTAIRPAPTTVPADLYSAPRLVDPQVSTQAYIDTDRGTIQIEFAVLDAPLTVESFVTLARKGYFDGLTIHRVVPDFVVQDGDPRGDGEGGPGYTIRDELNERPYLRGTVGMALDWNDTGGSQFFITHSPQPHLDAKYTVFGRVISGMDVVDAIQQGDVIRKVRIWDGTGAAPSK
jgi:cyclophilin family peptidyl-prolyl cis-trans isomerase/HEAT repeat protein